MAWRLVSERAFTLPKGKQQFAWQSPDSILVAREWNKGELTTSGYPYIVKQVRRGQPLAEAGTLLAENRRTETTRK